MPPDTLGVDLILLQPVDRLGVMPFACVSNTTKENKDSEITQLTPQPDKLRIRPVKAIAPCR